MFLDLLQKHKTYSMNTGKYEIIFTELRSCVFDNINPRNGLHRHDCFEICFVEEGNGFFIYENKEFPVENSCIFLGIPLIPHEVLLKKSVYLKVSYLAFNIIKRNECESSTAEDIIVENFLTAQYPVSYQQTHIRDYINMLNQYHLHGGTYAVKNLIFTMIMDMLKSFSHNQFVVEYAQLQTKKKIDDYIYNNINRKISVSDLCTFTGLSERSLFYFFKNNFDVTPNNYILGMKISAASVPLKMGIPIKNIAAQFGFGDSSSFCRSFKRIKGITPKEFVRIS